MYTNRQQQTFCESCGNKPSDPFALCFNVRTLLLFLQSLPEMERPTHKLHSSLGLVLTLLSHLPLQAWDSFGYTLNYVRGRHIINEGFVLRTEKIMYCKHWITKTRWSMHFPFIFFMAVWISLLVLGISWMPLAPAELHEVEIRRNGFPSES